MLPAAAERLFTIGHGAGSAGEFLHRCRRAALDAVVDVRSLPGSRRHPHFGRADMERWLPDAGLAYSWEPDLGGFRRPLPDSPNGGLRHPSFRGYADHMAGPAFASALRRVLEQGRSVRVAVMCSETLWWRCHRRLIADAAELLHGVEVEHIDGRGEQQRHRVTPGVQLESGVLVYRAVSTA